jgi:hypothetical protein
MGKLFGILAIVLGVWLAAEVGMKGIDGAFGGILASEQAAAPTGDPVAGSAQAVPQRAATKVDRAHREAQQRRERLLGE